MENQPKFDLVEIILGSIFALLIDALAAIADVFSFAVLGFIVQALSWLLFTLWFTLKGVSVTSSLVKRFLVPIAVQLIPVIPTTIFTFLVTVYMENHPEKFAAVKKVAGQAGGAVVGAAVGGPAGAKVGQAVGGYAMGQSAKDAAGNAAMPTKVPLKKAA